MSEPGDRVIIECCFAVAEPPDGELAALHCGLLAYGLLEMPAHRVACMVSDPGRVFWVLLGATLEQLHRAKDWLAENSSPVLQHTVMRCPLPGKEVL